MIDKWQSTDRLANSRVDPYSSVTLMRVGTGPITMEPERVRIDAGMFGVPPAGRAGRFRLQVTDGWRAIPAGKLAWDLVPEQIDVDRPLGMELRRESADGVSVWHLSTPVRLDLTSTLDPIAHAFQEPNRASVLGDILPQREIFNLTYKQPSVFLADELFAGLYSDIVFLRRDGPTRGGLCSGMARWAIARSLGDEPEPSSRDEALQRITTYHGRQLTDRAFLLGAPWFLRGSPRASYRRVRRDLLRKGSTDRAFDIAIPKPWRRDVVSALIDTGHTIVPYRIVQHNPSRATVEVYDPNRPPATLETPQAVEFDLLNNRYSYRHMVSMDENNVGLVVARQHAYAERGTAIAAGIVSAVMRFMEKRTTRWAQESPASEPAGL